MSSAVIPRSDATPGMVPQFKNPVNPDWRAGALSQHDASATFCILAQLRFFISAKPYVAYASGSDELPKWTTSSGLWTKPNFSPARWNPQPTELRGAVCLR